MISSSIPPSLLSAVEAQGWPKALYENLRSRGAEGYLEVGDERRADWIYLLPLSKESSVLLIGAEWGHSAVALARRCKTVTVFDSVSEKRDFLRLRAAQEEIPNLAVIESLPDASFDLIAVLEFLSDEKKLFHSINTRLKKGGTVYVASKSLGIRQKLLAAGFFNPAIYAVLPGHAMPLFLVPLSSPACIKYFLQHVFYLLATASMEVKRRYWIPYQLAKIGIRCLPGRLLSFFFKRFAPAFAFIAQKQ